MTRVKQYFLFSLPLLSALLLILSFPPWNKGYLAWICLLPLFIYLQERGAGWKNSFFSGFGTGILFFLVIFAYMALSVNFLFPRYLGILVVIASSIYSAVFFGVFSLAFLFFLRCKNIILSALAIPASWVILEYLRSLGFLGHTGGFLGYSQSNYVCLLQSISLFGYWGLPFLIVLFQTILFFSLYSFFKNSKKCCREIVTSLSIFLLMLGCGTYLPSLFPSIEEGDTIRIALIQGNIPQENILDPSMAAANFQKYLDLTREAHALYAPLDLIVWPETVLSTSVVRNFPQAEREIGLLAEEIKAAILFGAMYEEKEQEKVYNSILLQKSDGTLRENGRYDKNRLVPFAEYFPFPEILNKIWPVKVSLGTYTPGEGTGLFHLDKLTFGGIVCFESYFSQPALNMAQKGGQHLFVLTNDAWFLDSSGVEQHARASAIRAAEAGIGVTQVANTGRTVSFDYRGKEVISLPILEEGIALLETNMPARITLYRLWGDYFLYFCTGLLLLPLFTFTIRIEKREKPAA